MSLICSVGFRILRLPWLFITPKIDPPGTGKTLTAEATSERKSNHFLSIVDSSHFRIVVRKPLYVVTAGELGNDADKMSHILNHIFSICAIWDAVVLLDEADVFLERRSVHEVQRNAMVSVFLHQLE